MPRAAHVAVLAPVLAPVLAALLLSVMGAPAHATVEDAREHRRADHSRATPTPTQPTVEAYAVPVSRRVTYSVTTRGRVTAPMAVFRRQAQQTFDHPRGWRAAGVQFRRVRRGGDFTLVLAAAGTLPSFSSGCSVQWSCRVGRHVVINQLRWTQASPAWDAAGRSLRDYRHMVVNHETGHWLGRGHTTCRGRGPAPVMMQQSKGTGGCRFNPWPLAREAAAVRRR